MSNSDAPKSVSQRRSTDKRLSNDAFSTGSNASSSARVNDINVNTPSPSSVGSASTVDQSSHERSTFTRNPRRSASVFKRRHRFERLIHLANHQYIMAMTNILSQMQRDIHQLKRRANRVDHVLSQQIQCGYPVIRLPRLTKDDLTVTAVNESQPEDCHEIYEENEKTPAQNKTPNENERTTKFCSLCQHEFSSRQAFLQHRRKMHQEEISDETTEENFNANLSDQSVVESDVENDGFQLSVNPWDVGEGRLRPRPVPLVRQLKTPRKKVKCDVCNKIYDASNIEKHKARAHREPSPVHMDEEIVPVFESLPIVPLPDAIGSLSQLIIPSPHHTESPSTLNIADMEHDNSPIQFSTESRKAIVFATTFTDRQQKNTLEEFLRKFSGLVRQCPSINEETTHLIVNDERTPLRSPLTLRLIEGVAHHCYCVSFNWIYDCLKYDRLIEEITYEINGDDTEHPAHGGPQRSRLASTNDKLFRNFAFIIKCSENGENSMSNDQLRHLIGVCGGKITDYITQQIRNEYEIIVLCDQLFVSQRRTNYQQCQRLQIRFLSPNWVIRSIVEYRLKPFEGFEEVPM